MADQSKSKLAKVAQYRNLIILAGVVLLGFTGLIYMVSDDTTNKNQVSLKSNFSNPLDHVDAESAVLEHTQTQLKESDKKTDHLQKQIDSLINEKKSVPTSNQENEELKKRIDALEKQVSNPPSNEIPDTNPGIAGSAAYQANFLGVPSVSTNGQAGGGAEMGQSIREDSLKLSPSAEDIAKQAPLKNPDTYVPSGTFAKAVMIGGADASTAVNSPENPNPMLFRIIEEGTLPNKRKSHLKDCVVLAHVAGDISSERGEITIQRLSCTFPNNEIVDQEAHGWVFGADGKFGVRGKPVWREGALLQRAFAAGALSGISDGISQSYRTNSISADGNVQTVNAGKVFQVGASNGMSKAMNKLADYNIQRAEQYHPVIQISAGAIVDVVFRDGFFLDGKKHENKDSSVGNYSEGSETVLPMNTAPIFSPSKDEAKILPLSADEVKKIQENSQALGLKVTTQASAPQEKQ